ncbi:hypothetical protein Dda_4560 [Drechslerella dactyloides]|uniref:Uncharacterized protein n=1 Tax=Drechslerella dactyloides TaxID=74499 RepID=A0AAD6NJ81_DREDA|nr:hypothetical protein Dda_4560 [Drechslerella dactyloides]
MAWAQGGSRRKKKPPCALGAAGLIHHDLDDRTSGEYEVQVRHPLKCSIPPAHRPVCKLNVSAERIVDAQILCFQPTVSNERTNERADDGSLLACWVCRKGNGGAVCLTNALTPVCATASAFQVIPPDSRWTRKIPERCFSVEG